MHGGLFVPCALRFETGDLRAAWQGSLTVYERCGSGRGGSGAGL